MNSKYVYLFNTKLKQIIVIEQNCENLDSLKYVFSSNNHGFS